VIDRDDLITHILTMMKLDIDYARLALRQFHRWLPDMDLINVVRDALAKQKQETKNG
jgi:hypothetical protein